MKKGAKKQRLLWASTSVKNPAYPDTLYVAPLIGPDTVSNFFRVPLIVLLVNACCRGCVVWWFDKILVMVKIHLKTLTKTAILLQRRE